MGIDVSKIRVGDEITMKGTVSSVHPAVSLQGVYFVADGRYAVRCEDIVAHHPKPREIKAGDMVKLSGLGEPRRVLHVHKDRAWLEDSGVLWPVSDLRHAD